ncbi:Qat anti-phage system TatD family nuclease QatD [Rubinisphaera brasiliensis]|uniref:TatD-related deoxyribonuclease n=1 Tax=Rubinisphaera brasiliensis (strain ATCC 49424 / DSM 5305 / JCM 21570 / IAM 15109 / NBRC 103401 / IFAM 1448) TaxID=756272 RepID=F0SJ42_RUBBR|nr:Qat anti-phage system TatD family nuclease QatD [Rubinisphaera brasiliensis]ADY58584.1 TatD-related deoxyribonuclease [Rubinisphaera brasiliensis DSM 5305]
MLLDSHCHIDRYPDPLALSNECESRRIFTVAVTNLPSHYQMAVQHLSGMQYVKPALGFHPLAVAENEDELSLFETLLSNAEFVGEVGLDYSKQGLASKEVQLQAFRRIAKALSAMPRIVTIHSRKSAADVLEIVDENRISHAIFHWYSDSVTVLHKAIQSGHYFSINTAMLQSKSGQTVIDSVPRDRILTETDGPYVKARRKPAKPSDVRSVLQGIANRWGIEADGVEEQITENFHALCNGLSIRLPQGMSPRVDCENQS